MNCKGFLQSVLICLLSVAVLCAAPNLDKGKSIFKDNCGTCHNKNMKDDMTGPALGGVQERWAGYPKEDLYKWIRNSQSMVSAGHPEATKLFQKWKTTMTAFPTLSDEDIENLLGYIEAVNNGTYGPKVEVPGQAVSGANTSKESGFSWWMYGIFGLLGIIALFLWNIISELNYPKLLKSSTEDFLQMHNAEWNQTIEISEHFSLLKHQYQWNNYMPDKDIFDLVYYDAFGPGHDESLWSLASTIKLNSMMSIAGILCTFCAQGQFKRNLKASGFQVESLSGPIGKREVIRATKHSDI